MLWHLSYLQKSTNQQTPTPYTPNLTWTQAFTSGMIVANFIVNLFAMETMPLAGSDTEKLYDSVLSRPHLLQIPLIDNL